MSQHNCNNCDNCKVMKKRLDTYEQFMKELQELDKQDTNYNTNPLEESVIVEKDNFGNINKKVRSDLTESFLVVDRPKNLKELSKKEQQSIEEQDSYHNYKNTSEKIKKAKGYYAPVGYIMKFGKWLIFL